MNGTSPDQTAELARVWTWNIWHECYPWTDDGAAIKAWRTPEEALADCQREWSSDDGQAVPIVLQIDGGGS